MFCCLGLYAKAQTSYDEKKELQNAFDSISPVDSIKKSKTVVVKAKRINKKGTELEALDIQKKATTLVEVKSSAELSRTGKSNASEAVGAFAGVSKQEAGDEVYVRGLGDRYINTTLNGLPLPSNNINKKNIELGLFATDVIDNISVSKTYSGNMSGDFSAGNIDIISKENTEKNFINVSIGAGLNTRAVGKDFLKSEGTGSFGYYNRYNSHPFAVILSHGVDAEKQNMPFNSSISLSTGNIFRINDNSKLSYFLSGSFDRNLDYISGLEGSYLNTKMTFYPEVERFITHLSTSAMANVVYNYNNDHKIHYNLLYINNAKDEVGRYGTDGQGIDQNVAQDGGFFTQNTQFNQDQIIVNQLLGEHKLSEKVNLEWKTSYNRVDANEPDRKRITITHYGTQAMTLSDESSFANQRFFSEINENDYNAQLSLTYKNEKMKFKLGYAGRWKDRDFESHRYELDGVNGIAVEDVNYLNGIFNYNNFAPFGNFEGGKLYTTRVLNAIPMGENQTLGVVGVPGLPESMYNGDLQTQAGFATLDWNISEKVTLIPSIRIEKIVQKINYNIVTLVPNYGENEIDETLFLPSFNVKYSPNTKNNIRLGLSKTASIPEFKEVAPFTYEGVVERIGGNPNLELSNIYNADLKWEYFPKSGEMFSVGVFGKSIQDAINLVLANDATNTLRYFNTGDAIVFGIEGEIKKKLFVFDNGDIALNANASYMYTNQKLHNQDSGIFTTTFDREEDDLQGASPFILHADIAYNATFNTYKPTFTLGFNYYSDRIYALGAAGVGNKIEKAVPTLDLIWKNKIGKNAELNFSAKNILDPSIEVEQENTEDGTVLINSYKAGVNLGVNFSYKF